MIHKIHRCSDGRVVKALDLKSNGVSPRRFKSCSLRATFVKVFFPACFFWQGFFVLGFKHNECGTIFPITLQQGLLAQLIEHSTDNSKAEP